MSAARYDAMVAYHERFGEHPPLTAAIPETLDPDLIAAMRGAVERGRKLSQAEVLAVAGMTAPRVGPGEPPPDL
jgi:DNA-binding phage protein